jgi:hypothetical protein
VTDSHETQIAAQALKALHLHRLRERGQLTQQEYLDGLNAAQQGVHVLATADTARPTDEHDDHDRAVKLRR